MTRKPGVAVAVALGVALLGLAARAEVAPGDRITDQNIDKVKDLISPGMEWCIKRGFPMTIVEPRRIEWPKATRRPPRSTPAR